MSQRKRWPKLIAIAVLTAVAAAAGIEAAYVALAYSEGATVALPGRPAGEDILNIRGALNGPCLPNNPFDDCNVSISCGTTGNACSTPGANCTNGNYSGSLNYYCQNFYLFSSCTEYTTSCLSDSTNGCTNVPGGGCNCQGTYPAWSSGVVHTCS